MSIRHRLISMQQKTIIQLRHEIGNPDYTQHSTDSAYLKKTIEEVSAYLMEDTQEVIKLDTKNFQIEITPDTAHGFFEHNIHGDNYGGGLWFQGKELVDCDGTPSLPKEVATALRDVGYVVSEDFD